MTANIINYLNERETERSNVARETETTRHNMRVEAETQRHNMRMEELQKEQIAAQKSAAKYSADQSRSAARYSADKNYAQTVLNVGATKQKVFYDYLVGSGANAVNRERNTIQSRYNEGQLAIAAATQRENARHNQAYESISYLKEANTMSRFAQQLLLDSSKFEHQQWHDWQQVEIGKYDATTKRIDTLWKNANSTGRLVKDWAADKKSTTKPDTLTQFFQGLRD